MIGRRRVWAVLIAAAVATRSAGSEAAGVDAFASRVRRATERYHDRQRAILDGYRLVGRDSPGMGEHWLNAGLLFDGRYEPEQPEFLSYAEVAGVPRLLGVAYALPLRAGEAPPEEPAGRQAWHTHTGTLGEETAHAGHKRHAHAAHASRLAMVHAWVWLENPEGMFAADNWAIPYVRLGLTAPPHAPASVGKALALVSGGDGHLRSILRANGFASAETEAAIERARVAVANGIAELRSRSCGRPACDVDPSDVAWLASTWDHLWRELQASVKPDDAERLRALPIR
jgi:hypothetical protein